MFTDCQTVILKPSDHPPKYPGNAYSLFLREQFANYPKPPTLADCRVVVTSIAREWRALSDSEKAVRLPFSFAVPFWVSPQIFIHANMSSPY